VSCCCGGKRAALRNATAPRAALPRVVLEYLGTELLVQIGPVTGMRYHFGSRGALVSVDARDAARMLARGDLRRAPAAGE